MNIKRLFCVMFIMFNIFNVNVYALKNTNVRSSDNAPYYIKFNNTLYICVVDGISFVDTSSIENDYDGIYQILVPKHIHKDYYDKCCIVCLKCIKDDIENNRLSNVEVNSDDNENELRSILDDINADINIIEKKANQESNIIYISIFIGLPLLMVLCYIIESL